MHNTIHAKPLVHGMKFGIELEIEAGGLYEAEEVFDNENDEYHQEEPDIPLGWNKEQEDSIVGCELVSQGPIDYDSAVEDIERLFKDIDFQGFKPLRTPRGSTHVHANVCDLTWEQMRSFVMACAWAEPALIELAGKGRKGNLFAQSYEICPIGWQGIIESIQQESVPITVNHDTHYMATSFYPMATLGSVEFRMGPSARNAQDAIDWLANIKHVVQCGRDTRVDTEMPHCMEYLMTKINPMKKDMILRKAQRQANEIWCGMNRKPRKRTRNKIQELTEQYQVYSTAMNPSVGLSPTLTSPEHPMNIAAQLQQVAQVSPQAAMQISHDWFNQLYPSQPTTDELIINESDHIAQQILGTEF